MFVRSARTLGMLVREQRRRLGLTQAQLARRAGVSRQWLSGLERGREGAELGRVLRTLACAGVILKFEEPQPSPLDPTAVVEAHRSPLPE
jgi:transcriptional regulator with XRE-family HTH domain